MALFGWTEIWLILARVERRSGPGVPKALPAIPLV
jgi:hypothetical protein